ncbi:hypothetical protein ADUPG1_006239 [Aduncisulcus paluster]|uniref:Uncharacterized protein n=1 Tax=Aduncisulcus paluster TaxID=2918883 RepID=A0ABQ5KJ26_9EUKA|nr:hypothetical protein ADUPG1_006239 [Aduncisulcus paluster]
MSDNIICVLVQAPLRTHRGLFDQICKALADSATVSRRSSKKFSFFPEAMEISNIPHFVCFKVKINPRASISHHSIERIFSKNDCIIIPQNVKSSQFYEVKGYTHHDFKILERRGEIPTSCFIHKDPTTSNRFLYGFWDELGIGLERFPREPSKSPSHRPPLSPFVSSSPRHSTFDCSGEDSSSFCSPTKIGPSRDKSKRIFGDKPSQSPSPPRVSRIPSMFEISSTGDDFPYHSSHGERCYPRKTQKADLRTFVKVVDDLRKCCPSCVSSITATVEDHGQCKIYADSQKQLDAIEACMIRINSPNTKIKPFTSSKFWAATFSGVISKFHFTPGFFEKWYELIIDHFRSKRRCSDLPHVKMTWNKQLKYFHVALYYVNERAGEIIPIDPEDSKQLKEKFQHVSEIDVSSDTVSRRIQEDISSFKNFFTSHTCIGIFDKYLGKSIVWGPCSDKKRRILHQDVLRSLGEGYRTPSPPRVRGGHRRGSASYSDHSYDDIHL